ncbi:MAG: type II toxin-antitoxin system RelE/ParE family toxin [Flavobacteriales bacterium]|nr:type II toxin-antitoxin system RelE/ParE family toxin [Flavobacteriales bacterium]
MEIQFANKKIEKTLTSPRELMKAHNQLAKNIAKRLTEFRDADTLEDIRNLPQANCHELKGNYKGHLAVNISGNWRMIFKPGNNPIAKKEIGGILWEGITIVCIEEITDYH